MSEEFNIFEDEKVQEIVWDKIIQDFSTSQMNIDNFCMMKEISKEELQSRIKDKMTSFSEAQLKKNLVFHEDDIVELTPAVSDKTSGNIRIKVKNLTIEIPTFAERYIFELIFQLAGAL